jgi:uncharacterized membrane protein YhiD involved in acid resistance
MTEFMDPEIIIFGKLALAALLGMFLGTERVFAGKTAGTRTFALVGLGACLMVVVSSQVTSSYLGFVNFDPLRVAAAIITGVGFLGAGTIIFHNNVAYGLTTAAGLWVVAAVGMAVGFGMYSVAIFTTALTLFIFTAVWFVEYKIKQWFVARKPVIIAHHDNSDAHDSYDEATERDKRPLSEELQ